MGIRAPRKLEVLALRHQLQVLQRTRPRRVRLAKADRGAGISHRPDGAVTRWYQERFGGGGKRGRKLSLSRWRGNC